MQHPRASFHARPSLWRTPILYFARSLSDSPLRRPRTPPPLRRTPASSPPPSTRPSAAPPPSLTTPLAVPRPIAAPHPLLLAQPPRELPRRRSRAPIATAHRRHPSLALLSSSKATQRCALAFLTSHDPPPSPPALTVAGFSRPSSLCSFPHGQGPRVRIWKSPGGCLRSSRLRRIVL